MYAAPHVHGVKLRTLASLTVHDVVGGVAHVPELRHSQMLMFGCKMLVPLFAPVAVRKNDNGTVPVSA